MLITVFIHPWISGSEGKASSDSHAPPKANIRTETPPAAQATAKHMMQAIQFGKRSLSLLAMK